MDTLWRSERLEDAAQCLLESLIERILVQISQDLGQVHKSFLLCGDETSRRQWCTERFELSSTASANLGLDSECRVGRGPEGAS